MFAKLLSPQLLLNLPVLTHSCYHVAEILAKALLPTLLFCISPDFVAALQHEALDDLGCIRPAACFDEMTQVTLLSRSICEVKVWILSWFLNGISLR